MTRIRAAPTWGVLDVLPDQRGGAGLALDVQEQQRFRRMDGELFELVVGAVALDVVDAHEPRILGVGDHQPAAGILQRGMAQGHVVGDRAQLAALGQVDVPLFTGDHVLTQQHAAVGVAVGVFQHLALAAPARPFVHDGQDVVVGRHHLDGGAVGGEPTLAFADVEQHPVDALLGARPRIEVEREHLVAVALAVMHHHLPAIAMGMAEGGGEEHLRPGGEAERQVLGRDHALEVGHAGGEEGRIPGGDEQAAIAQARVAGPERQDHQRLGRQPGHHLPAQVGERHREAVGESRLFGRQVVGDHHAVGIAAPHVGIAVVDGHAVAGAHDVGFDHPAPVRHFEGDLETVVAGPAQGTVDQLGARGGRHDGGCGVEEGREVGGQVEAVGDRLVVHDAPWCGGWAA